MITLSHPQLLFEKQKIYRLPKVVEKQVNAEPKPNIKMLMIFNQTAKVLAETHQILLDNMVKACKLAKSDVLFINATCELDLLNEWERRYPNALVLLLGDVSFDTKFQQVKINELKKIGASSLLKALPIEQLAQSKEGKAELWRLLQLHFKL